MAMMLKLLVLSILITGVFYFTRHRLGVFVLVLLLPGLVLGYAGTLFLTFAYIILTSVIICLGGLIYLMVKMLSLSSRRVVDSEHSNFHVIR